MTDAQDAAHRAAHLDTLPPPWRLALAYAPVQARGPWLSFLALDVRLAGVVRQAREPMLGQMKLAWWRDRFNADPETWPKGEPLLASLRGWGAHAKGLVPLIDGWETLLDEWDHGTALTQGRIAGMQALADAVGAGKSEAVAAMARGWAAMDVASHLGDEAERAKAMERLGDLDWRRHRLPRTLRPLTVLHGMARRTRSGGDSASPMALAHAIRLGIFGA